MKSNFLSLNLKDFGKGLFLAVVAAVLTFAYNALQAGTLFDKATWGKMGIAALTTALAYIMKQFITNSQNQLMVSEKNATPEIVKPLQNVPLSKILILAVILSGIGLTSNAQISLTKPIPKDWGKLVGTTDNTKLALSTAANLTYQWIPRLNVGIQGVSYDLKGHTPKTLDAICFGISWLRYKDVDGVPFNDFGINLILLIDTQTKGYGLGVYGTYNLIGSTALVNLGTHYDFSLKTEFIDTGLTFHY